MKIKIARILGVPLVAVAISGCAFFSDGVVTAVESHYVTGKRDVLTISGATATHPLHGIFVVDTPIKEDKPYRNDDNNATLTFHSTGPGQQAIIEFDDNSPRALFDMHLFGGPVKSTVLGIYW